MDEHRTHFPKRFTEQEIAQHLPTHELASRCADNSIRRHAADHRSGTGALRGTKLNVIMNNTLSHPITITSMTFGEFFGDRLYLFREQTLDAPDDTEYDVQNYESLSVEIGGYGSKTLTFTSIPHTHGRMQARTRHIPSVSPQVQLPMTPYLSSTNTAAL